jgi:hypothetical protein
MTTHQIIEKLYGTLQIAVRCSSKEKRALWATRLRSIVGVAHIEILAGIFSVWRLPGEYAFFAVKISTIQVINQVHQTHYDPS